MCWIKKSLYFCCYDFLPNSAIMFHFLDSIYFIISSALNLCKSMSTDKKMGLMDNNLECLHFLHSSCSSTSYLCLSYSFFILILFSLILQLTKLQEDTVSSILKESKATPLTQVFVKTSKCQFLYLSRGSKIFISLVTGL